jgi:formylglycine-generating enzyme required for sulfatase activity
VEERSKTAIFYCPPRGHAKIESWGATNGGHRADVPDDGNMSCPRFVAGQLSLEAKEQCPDAAMVSIPGGTFRLGSEQHYSEEAFVHRVTVSPFRIDRTPVANRLCRDFVDETGYITVAERASMRAKLLTPLSSCRTPCTTDRQRHEPCRVSLRRQADGGFLMAGDRRENVWTRSNVAW